MDAPRDADPEAAEPAVTLAPPAGSDPPMPVLHPSTAPLARLVDGARGGDDACFEELVHRTHRETYTLARRLVSDADDARDVVQEAYLRAYRSIGSFRGDAQFTTWLYRITANCASTHLGRRRKHRHDELDDLDLADPEPGHDPATAADADSEAELQARLHDDASDLDARHKLGALYLAVGQDKAALDQFITILRSDRKFGDDLGRKSLVEAFRIVRDADLVGDYRRQMSSLLF